MSWRRSRGGGWPCLIPSEPSSYRTSHLCWHVKTGSLLVSREDLGHGYREVHSNLCSHVFLSRVPVICPKPERTGFSQVQNHQVPALPLVPLYPPPAPA